MCFVFFFCCYFFFQAEDGIRYLVRSRGLGDVYKRQVLLSLCKNGDFSFASVFICGPSFTALVQLPASSFVCLLYTSDAADERSSVDLGGRRIIKKKKRLEMVRGTDEKLMRETSD